MIPKLKFSKKTRMSITTKMLLLLCSFTIAKSYGFQNIKKSNTEASTVSSIDKKYLSAPPIIDCFTIPGPNGVLNNFIRVNAPLDFEVTGNPAIDNPKFDDLFDNVYAIPSPTVSGAPNAELRFIEYRIRIALNTTCEEGREFSIVKIWNAVNPHTHEVSECRQAIRVLDRNPRLLNCPGDQSIEITEIPIIGVNAKVNSVPADNTGTGSPNVRDVFDDSDPNDPYITSLEYVDTNLSENEDGTYTFTRTWTATDSCEQTNTTGFNQTQITRCIQTITVTVVNPAFEDPSCFDPKKINYADINTADIPAIQNLIDQGSNLPDAIRSLLNEPAQDPDIFVLLGVDPLNQVLPPGFTLREVGTAIRYPNDQCDFNFNIRKIWRIIDSNNNVIDRCSQVIKLRDKTGPILSNCEEPEPINSTDVAGINVIQNLISDNTNNITTVVGAIEELLTSNNISTILGIPTPTAIDDLDGTPITIEALNDSINILPNSTNPCNDNFNIIRKWIATDACGNQSNCKQRIRIRDLTAPDIFCPTPNNGNTFDFAVIALLPEIQEIIATNTDVTNVFEAVRKIVEDGDPDTDISDILGVEKPTTEDDLGEGNVAIDIVPELIGDTIKTPKNGCPEDMNIVRRWRAIDACGNRGAICRQVIRIRNVCHTASLSTSTNTEASKQLGGTSRITHTTFPNPFKYITTVTLKTTKASDRLVAQVFTINGKLVKTLYDNGVKANTSYKLQFNATGLPFGLYVYQITTSDTIEFGKIIHIK